MVDRFRQIANEANSSYQTISSRLGGLSADTSVSTALKNNLEKVNNESSDEVDYGSSGNGAKVASTIIGATLSLASLTPVVLALANKGGSSSGADGVDVHLSNFKNDPSKSNRKALENDRATLRVNANDLQTQITQKKAQIAELTEQITDEGKFTELKQQKEAQMAH